MPGISKSKSSVTPGNRVVNPIQQWLRPLLITSWPLWDLPSAAFFCFFSWNKRNEAVIQAKRRPITSLIWNSLWKKQHQQNLLVLWPSSSKNSIHKGYRLKPSVPDLPCLHVLTSASCDPSLQKEFENVNISRHLHPKKNKHNQGTKKIQEKQSLGLLFLFAIPKNAMFFGIFGGSFPFSPPRLHLLPPPRTERLQIVVHVSSMAIPVLDGWFEAPPMAFHGGFKEANLVSWCFYVPPLMASEHFFERF